MKNLAHLLPVMDAPSLAKTDVSYAPPPPLQLVANNDFILAPILNEQSDEFSSETISDRFQEGYDTGYALGLSHGRSQVKAETAGKDVAIEAYVAQMRSQWTAEQSQKIADGITKALKIIEAEVSVCVERCLQQMLDEQLRARALQDFSLAVRDLLRFGAAGIITVHAPDDLIHPLKALLRDCPTLEFETSDQAQVWVRSGATLIEARLDSWAKSLQATE
jgi:hypothetical protein